MKQKQTSPISDGFRISFRRNDMIVIGISVAVIIAAFIIRAFLYSSAGRTALITVDGVEYASCDLARDCELTIPGYRGGECLLRITDGAADIISADCPDKICVHHSPISHSGECIICLPNRVVVEITGTSGPEVDAVSE